MVTLHVARTGELGPVLRRQFRTLLDEAFDDDFTSEDWQHALGGVHVWLTDGIGVIGHGALVERTIACGDHEWRVGYVEALATQAAHRRRGHGTAIMTHLGDLIRERYAFGALSTGTPAFYQSLGWEPWRGPTFVQAAGGRVRTPDDDGGILILRTPRTPSLGLDDAIVCDWRSGDVW